MRIELKKIKLENFKGIKKLEIDFSKRTDISGQNATGKTTIFDAFTWLLFDKDSTDRKSFGIKTLDSNNNEIHGLEHSVECELAVDGEILSLRKVYKEKWTKKRGEENEELTGHTTDYYRDDVPVKMKEYNDTVNQIIDENIFKLVTNPLYFNQNLHWKERRDLLLEISGDVSTEDILNSKAKLKPLEKLLEKKNIEDLQKSLNHKKKMINDELDKIPIRIDEAMKSLEEYDIDFEAVEKEIESKEKEIEAIEKQINDESQKDKEISELKSRKYKLEIELNQIRHQKQLKADEPLRELQEALRNKEYEIKEVKQDIKNIQSSLEREEQNRKMNEETIKSLNEEIKELEEETQELREEYKKIVGSELTIDENEFICPTCGQSLPEDKKEEKIEEMKINFNTEKDKKIAKIKQKGTSNNKKIEAKREQIQKLENVKETDTQELPKLNKKLDLLLEEKRKLEKQIEDFKPSTEETEAEKKLKKSIEHLEEKIKNTQEVDTTELKEKKKELIREQDQLKEKLSYRNQQKKIQERIKELREQEAKLNKEYSNLEKYENLTDEFITTKVNILEQKINSRFKNTRFKLFERQINGGIKETCSTLINGVPFEDANNAGKIQSGIDVINVLSDYYKIQAPIFIDNRESVNEIPETDNQIINLIVTTDKKLKIENREFEEVK
jgi:DNA repair exonuclease SbcCD ATPase subunit